MFDSDEDPSSSLEDRVQTLEFRLKESTNDTSVMYYGLAEELGDVKQCVERIEKSIKKNASSMGWIKALTPIAVIVSGLISTLIHALLGK